MKNTNRYKEVADLLRTGHSSPELEAEYEQLKREHNSRPRQSHPVKSIWDLDVTRCCWEGDAREIER